MKIKIQHVCYFQDKYGKIYESADEEEFRYNIFKLNLGIIEEHNAAYDRGDSTFYLGITNFADLTKEEFIRQIDVHKVEFEMPVGDTFGESSLLEISLPPSLDWREKGIITNVHVQKNCSSVWASSAVSIKFHIIFLNLNKPNKLYGNYQIQHLQKQQLKHLKRNKKVNSW